MSTANYAADASAQSRLLVLALCLVAGFAGFFLKGVPEPVAPVAPVPAPAPYYPAPVAPVCPGPNCRPSRPFGVTCCFCQRGLVVTPPVLGQAVGKSIGLAT